VGNVITARYPAPAQSLRIENDLMSAVFETLTLAAWELAATDWETQLARWLVQHDQARVGQGAVSVDLTDLGWSADGFADEKRFLLEIIEAAAHETGWDRLPVRPDKRHVRAALGALTKLVSRIDKKVTAVANTAAWTKHAAVTSGFCDVHRVGLHELGCPICNSAPAAIKVAEAPYRTERVERLVSLASQALIMQKRNVQFPLEWSIIGAGEMSTVYVNDKHRADVQEGGIYATLTVTFSITDDVLNTAHYHTNKSVAGDTTLPVDEL
jgi:hypothetical protein